MNTFGNIFRLTTFGESHGKAVGGIIDGCPSGSKLDMDFIQKRVLQRSPISVIGGTNRIEYDRVEFLSGIKDRITLGTPIAFIIKNENICEKDYQKIAHVYRPGHADYTYQMRYGIRDYSGGGRASARETISRVVAGAIAEQWLKNHTITIDAYVDQIGSIRAPLGYDSKYSENSVLRCPDHVTEQLWVKLIEEVSKKGDTIGGIVRCSIKGVPAGIGEPIFGKIQSELAAGMMSIPAAKGFEYGLGMLSAEALGSENNDEMEIKDEKIHFKTNRAGGILGGITTGEEIYFRVAFKPVSSIKKLQHTVNDQSENIKIEINGRHDVCVAPRACAVVRAMAALVIMDQLLLRKDQ